MITLVVAVALLLGGHESVLVDRLTRRPGRDCRCRRIGDCLVFDASGPTSRPADCADASAEFRLLAVSVDRDGCVALPGAVRAYGEGNRFSCISNMAEPGNGAQRARDMWPSRPTVPSAPAARVAPRHARGRRGMPKSHESGSVVRRLYAGGCQQRQTDLCLGLGGADGSESTTWDRLSCLGMS